jgi:hypothetical protein
VFAVQGQGPDLRIGVTFPIPAPAPVDSRHVVIAGNDVVDGAGCTGTAADPVAAPGDVCVHPTISANTDTGFGWARPAPAGTRPRPGTGAATGSWCR